MTTYYDLAYAYGIDNIKHLGNKVIVIDRHYKQALGYTIESYNGYTPDALKSKVYTSLDNINALTWDDVHDFLYGTPTQAPDFTQVITVVNS